MKTKFMRIISLLFVFFLVFTLPQNVKAIHTINVGFIDYKGFIERDSTGAYRGYAVDYLNEISKYTQWKYNYVFDTWDNCLEKLKNGEIDILCSAQYTKQRDQYFDYSKYSIGHEYTIIYTNLDEPIYFNDYTAMNHKKIGLLKDSYQNQSLTAYAKTHQFKYQEYYYNNEEDVVKALMNHEVDMIAVGSLPLHDQVKVVAKFDPQPFYITVKEGNQQLLDNVNEALSQIKNNSPYFEMELYSKYYSNSAYSTQPLLTRKEIEYIQKLDTIPVGVYDDMFPFSYVGKKERMEGMLIELLEKISEKSGLKFQYEKVSTREDGIRLINENKALFCGALKNSQDIIDGKYWSSQPLMNVDQVVVTRNEKSFETFNDSTLAILFGFESLGQNFLHNYPKANLQYCTTIEECLDAVNNGTADLTIYNAYTMNYLIQKPEYVDNLTAHSISLDPESVCIAANSEIDQQLVGILNKSIESFSNIEIDKIVYGYTIGYRYEYSLVDNLYLYRYSLLLISVIFILIAIMISYINKRHTQYLIDKRESDILRRKVEIDSLTGLYNYEAFFHKVKEILENDRQAFCMIYIDVNRFKIVNELYGMEVGNQLLAHLGGRLYQLTQHYETVVACHFSADKFFVFAPKVIYDQFIQIDLLEDYNIEMGISLRYGLYNIVDRRIAINLMCDRAALASQDIKNNYFQKVGVYDDQKRLQILREQQIIDAIEEALSDHQLFIMIQPRYDIVEEKITGGEALVRWKHPTKGYIPPSEFIPIIENNGYIIQLDYFVWEAACQFLQQIQKDGLDINISVNVSRLNFYRPHLVELLVNLVHKYGIKAQNLQLEITESVYSKDKEFIYSIICDLQKQGFTILMDDFGSGYSSLNMLKDAPVDIIKLDMNFLDSTNETNRSKAIIEAVVNLTHSLGMPVVVEGVETKQQLSFLKGIQVHYIQGYYFSKPLIENDFISLYKKTNYEK